ncbi:histidine kinase N-terminal 7TM domain-containing protein [Paenibacillus sp. YYML68]|uniref:sensor histidine kinase n=1 Tax=Paenibacillus sp. YYML68 TaxID=2909250 RepID=UPI002491FD41|nr:histidine kinase N-terminal 7TM domain-containing protein [Paenibacillus sp. YYML68]
MTLNIYISALLIVTACCSLYIAYLAWKRREYPVSIGLFFGMWVGALYAFGYAFEIVSSNLEMIRFWLRVQYIGISFGTLVWFIMVIQYTGRSTWLRKWTIALLSIVPLATFISHNTNEWHQLFYADMTLDYSAGFPLAALTPGPFYKLHVAYSYTLFAIGMCLLFVMHRSVAASMRRQVVTMMLGSCAPYGITLIYLSGVLHTPIDISPFGFLLSGIFYIWGIYQYNMLKLAPLALEKVFQSMKDAVVVLDMEHRVTSFNVAARDTFESLRHKRAIGQSASTVFDTYTELRALLHEPPPQERVLKLVTPKGLIYSQVQASWIYDSQQHPAGKLVMLSDVTEAVSVKETLVNNARQLQELNAFKDQMFTVVAHDIRDPLALLVSLMEVLKDELGTHEDNEVDIVQEMDRQVHNTFSLVESLLDWYRSLKGELMFNPCDWNLQQAVQHNITMLQVHSAAKRIAITADVPRDLSVYVDKEMLNLIIRNLLSNAVKFTGEDGHIQLTAKLVTADSVCVSIRDSGQGIGPEQAERLLKEAYTVSSSGTAGERGVGLGLTLCREFVRINGGAIWFESEPAHGTTFHFTMPVAHRGAPSHSTRSDEQ